MANAGKAQCSKCGTFCRVASVKNCFTVLRDGRRAVVASPARIWCNARVKAKLQNPTFSCMRIINDCQANKVKLTYSDLTALE